YFRKVFRTRRVLRAFRCGERLRERDTNCLYSVGKCHPERAARCFQKSCGLQQKRPQNIDAEQIVYENITVRRPYLSDNACALPKSVRPLLSIPIWGFPKLDWP